MKRKMITSVLTGVYLLLVATTVSAVEPVTSNWVESASRPVLAIATGEGYWFNVFDEGTSGGQLFARQRMIDRQIDGAYDLPYRIGHDSRGT